MQICINTHTDSTQIRHGCIHEFVVVACAIVLPYQDINLCLEIWNMHTSGYLIWVGLWHPEHLMELPILTIAAAYLQHMDCISYNKFREKSIELWLSRLFCLIKQTLRPSWKAFIGIHDKMHYETWEYWRLFQRYWMQIAPQFLLSWKFCSAYKTLVILGLNSKWFNKKIPSLLILSTQNEQSKWCTPELPSYISKTVHLIWGRLIEYLYIGG